MKKSVPDTVVRERTVTVVCDQLIAADSFNLVAGRQTIEAVRDCMWRLESGTTLHFPTLPVCYSFGLWGLV